MSWKDCFKNPSPSYEAGKWFLVSILCLATMVTGKLPAAAAAAAKSLQSCPTLCDPTDGPPGSAIPGILQARTLEWVATAFSIVWKWKVKVKSLSHVRLVATPWTATYQAPPSMGFSRQEYWSGLPLPSPKLPETSVNFYCQMMGERTYLPSPSASHPKLSRQERHLKRSWRRNEKYLGTAIITHTYLVITHLHSKSFDHKGEKAIF